MQQYNNNMEQYNPNAWRNKIGRNLTKKEFAIIKDSGYEYRMNLKINEIQIKLNMIGFKISDLSDLEGNCMYESIGQNIYENIETIKVKIRNHMEKWRNEQVINGNEMTLEEIFGIYNEIEFIKVNGKREKYTFDLMLIDLLQDNGWQRMPTEILLYVISKIYNKKIIIFRNNNNNGHSTINIIDNISDKKTNNNIAVDVDDEQEKTSEIDKMIIDNEENYLHDNKFIKIDDIGGDEIIIAKYLNNETYDLEKYKLTHEIINDSIKLALIDETHYVPVKSVVNLEKKVCVIAKYDKENENYLKLVANMNREIKEKDSDDSY